MTPKHLYIGLPAYDGRLMASTFISLMNFLMAPSPLLSAPPYIDILYGESHVNRVRNRHAKRFLNTDCTHMLFIDSDIGFTPQQITMLMERDLPIVGGIYAKKEIGPAQWVITPLRGTDKPDETGLIEVGCAGTGFVLIARHVFEEMKEPGKYPFPITLEYEDDSNQKMGRMWDFFHAGVIDDQWQSEDWWFSRAWRAMGGKVFSDTKCQLVHVGHADYPIKQ